MNEGAAVIHIPAEAKAFLVMAAIFAVVMIIGWILIKIGK